jgi:phosphatidylglycerol:prolipoprotein diacylglycerol transferase
VDFNYVSFPGLGLDFELRRYAFVIFGIEIYWYGIIITVGFLAAIAMAMRSCRKYDLTSDHILDIVLYGAPAAIIFARIYYVIFSWDQFRYDLVKIIKIRDGGLAIYGGVIGALLAVWLYTRKKKISFLHIADFGIPYLLFGQGVGRWGNFVNQEAFGTVTKLPWRMNGNEINKYIVSQGVDPAVYGVHPAFLYESLWDIAVFLFLLYYRKRKKVEGEVLFLYFILYGAGRALIETIRTDSLKLVNESGPRVSLLLSVLLVIAGLFLFIYRRIKKKQAEEEAAVVIGQSKYGALLMKIREEEALESAGEAGGEAAGDNSGDGTGREAAYSSDFDTGNGTVGTAPGADTSEMIEENEAGTETDK